MSTTSRAKKPIIAVVIIVIVLIAGAWYYTSQSAPSMSTTTGPITTGSTSAQGGAPSTLVIDDPFWPSGDLNQLNSLYAIPYPDWLTYTVYQALVTLDGNALYSSGDVKV